MGGLGLFIFGVNTTSSGLQKFAANRLRQILHSLTKRSFLAMIFGMVMTVAFQSSAATTVLVVEFVNAGLMNLAQALGIVLGSAVGTSLTIQLIAFKILNVALGAIFIGFILYLVKQGRWSHLGQALIGFGVIFVGMTYMAQASSPLKNIPQVYQFLAGLGSHPLLAILIGIILTAVIQSTPAVFAIMMSLAGEHVLSMATVIPLVIGAHTGGTLTTLLSSFTTPKMDAKRTAWANTGYKVLATIIILPFLPEFTALVQWTTANVQRQVANAHLLFSLFMVLIFFPFSNLIARGLVRLMPDKPTQDSYLTLKFIDEASVELPDVAIRQVGQEVNALAEFISNNMLGRTYQLLTTADSKTWEAIISAEKEVDWYYVRITEFLATLSNRGLTRKQAKDSLQAQFILKELEYIGDNFVVMVQVVQKLSSEQIYLSETEWKLLEDLYQRVRDNYSNVLAALDSWNKSLAHTVLQEHSGIMSIGRALQFAFLERNLCVGQEANFRREEKLLLALMDLGSLLASIDEHTANIAQVIIGLV